MFGTVLFCDEDFQRQLNKYFFPCCFPSQYGGKGVVNINELEEVENIEELTLFILKCILVNEN